MRDVDFEPSAWKKRKNEEPKFEGMQMLRDKQSIENVHTGEQVHLSPSEYQVLWMLARADGEIVLSSHLEEFLNDRYTDEEDLPLRASLGTFIVRLGGKLKSLFQGSVEIESVRGLGYRLSKKT